MPQNLRTVTPEYAKKVYGIIVTQNTPPPFSDEDPTLMPAPKRQKKIDVIWSDGTMPPLLPQSEDQPTNGGSLF
jgi:hypothetical protein